MRDMSTQINHSWEKVAQGRYATEYQGHILQAIRTNEPYHPEQRPYMAVVDRIPLEPGSWSLAEAKTKAIRHVTNHQTGRPKRNGHTLKSVEEMTTNEALSELFSGYAKEFAQELAQNPPPVPE